MFRDEEAWIQKYRRLGGLWKHNGKPSAPHAILSSEDHSGWFFNSRKIIEHDDVLWEAACALVEEFAIRCKLPLGQIDCVVGPQTGATKLSMMIAERISELTRNGCWSASPKKVEIDGVKSMQFTDNEVFRLRGLRSLLVEDVNTTGGSGDLAAQQVIAAEGTVLSWVLALVNRSRFKYAKGREVISLIHREMPNWKPQECPLCEIGSQPLKAKDNWDILMAG